MKRILILLLLVLTNQIVADEGVDIADPGQISKLNDVQESIDSVSETIMKCMEAGQEHNACMCANKERIVRFNAAVTELFSAYPEFEQLDLVSFRAADGTWVSQSLYSIRKQADAEHSCPG